MNDDGVHAFGNVRWALNETTARVWKHALGHCWKRALGFERDYCTRLETRARSLLETCVGL
jgi:hypothetical protein